MAEYIGTVTQVIGAVVDVHFDGELPAILTALHDRRQRPDPGARSGAAARREHRAHDCDGHDRRAGARRRGHRYRRPDHDAGRSGNLGPHPQRHRRAGRRTRPGRDQAALADPQVGAGIHRSVDRGRNPGHRDQGRRSADALRERRQDRAVRRRRGRQDRDHHGADQQHRQGAWRLLGVRRGRRAHPRGQRPLSRDDGIGRHQHRRAGLQGGARLWPDERAAGGARPGRPVRPHPRRIFPRRGRPGRAVLRRQHFPLYTGGLRSVGAARPHSVGGRLPADPGDRSGDPARSGSRAPRRARSPRCRRSMCRQTI